MAMTTWSGFGRGMVIVSRWSVIAAPESRQGPYGHTRAARSPSPCTGIARSHNSAGQVRTMRQAASSAHARAQPSPLPRRLPCPDRTAHPVATYRAVAEVAVRVLEPGPGAAVGGVAEVDGADAPALDVLPPLPHGPAAACARITWPPQRQPPLLLGLMSPPVAALGGGPCPPHARGHGQSCSSART